MELFRHILRQNEEIPAKHINDEFLLAQVYKKKREEEKTCIIATARQDLKKIAYKQVINRHHWRELTDNILKTPGSGKA